MRWKSYEDDLQEEARRRRGMSPEERLRALFSMIGFVARLSADTQTWASKLAVHEAEEAEARRRLREWRGRNRV